MIACNGGHIDSAPYITCLVIFMLEDVTGYIQKTKLQFFIIVFQFNLLIRLALVFFPSDNQDPIVVDIYFYLSIIYNVNTMPKKLKEVNHCSNASRVRLIPVQICVRSLSLFWNILFTFSDQDELGLLHVRVCMSHYLHVMISLKRPRVFYFFFRIYTFRSDTSQSSN